MANFTMELREVLRAHNIFEFAYPFYDEKKRPDFEKNFIRHFYFREICCPNIERFQMYLEDKFATVFPYYNELMKTATYEYDIENPYNLTETYTRNVDSMGKANGVQSVIDQIRKKETGQTDTESEANRNENQSSKGRDFQNDLTSNTTETEEKDASTSILDGSTVDKSHKTSEKGSSRTNSEDQKYMDTPQGLTNLNDTKYLTNLTRKTGQSADSENVSEDGTNTQTVHNSTVNDELKRSTVETSGELQSTVNRTNETDLSGKETQTGKAVTQSEGEQRSTQDSNVRSENIGKQTETYTMTRKGNIGVNPASHEVDHHILTQKTLKRIEEMFFNECEDLFMLVYE